MATKKTEAQPDLLSANTTPAGTLVSINIPQPAPVMGAAEEALAKAERFTISSAGDYQMVAAARIQISNRWNQTEADRIKLKAPSLEAGRRVDEFFAPALKVLAKAKEIATTKLTEWDTKQREIAAQKQREADALAEQQRREAEEAARKERERAAEEQRQRDAAAAAKLAEEQRIAREAAEAKAREEESRRKAAEAAAAGDKAAAKKAQEDAAASRAEAVKARAAQLKAEQDREAAEAETRRLQQESETRAQQLEQQAATTVAPRIQAETVEVAGLTKVATWQWRLVDKAKVKSDYLIVDEKAIGALVRSMKARAADVVGGIEVFQETGLRQQKG